MTWHGDLGGRTGHDISCPYTRIDVYVVTDNQKDCSHVGCSLLLWSKGFRLIVS